MWYKFGCLFSYWGNDSHKIRNSGYFGRDGVRAWDKKEAPSISHTLMFKLSPKVSIIMLHIQGGHTSSVPRTVLRYTCYPNIIIYHNPFLSQKGLDLDNNYMTRLFISYKNATYLSFVCISYCVIYVIFAAGAMAWTQSNRMFVVWPLHSLNQAEYPFWRPQMNPSGHSIP